MREGKRDNASVLKRGREGDMREGKRDRRALAHGNIPDRTRMS
jgi:hypothetical protein